MSSGSYRRRRAHVLDILFRILHRRQRVQIGGHNGVFSRQRGRPNSNVEYSSSTLLRLPGAAVTGALTPYQLVP